MSPATAQAPYSVTATSTVGTGIMTIEVTSTDQDAVAAWASAMAAQLKKLPTDYPVTLTVLDDPVRPTAPFAPDRQVILLLSFVVAAFMAVIAVLVADAFRARTDGAVEIRERFGVRVLAEIPLIRSSIAELAPDEFARHARAQAAVEALQALRSNVAFALAGRPHPWVAITSATQGEGKSFVAGHLSWLFASLQIDTVLLDVDVWRTRPGVIPGVSKSPGIADVDAGNLARVAQSTPSPHLKYVGTGQLDRHPAEVASTRLPLLLEQIGELGDTLVVDCPPLLSAAESVVYASGCGAALLVIDARRQDLDDVEQTIATLNDRRIEVLGIVINRSGRGNTRTAPTPMVVPEAAIAASNGSTTSKRSRSTH